MIKLQIVNRNDYEYHLKDEHGHDYIFIIDFFDIDEKPKNGDFIYINSELLNPKYEGYSTNYTFGNLESKYGKENISIDDIDVIKIITDNTEIYLKRLYG